MVLQQGVAYGRVAADVRVLQAVAGKPARQKACDGTLYAIMFVPVYKLVTKPEEGALSGAPRVSGTVEEDDVVLTAGLPDRLAVHLGPLLGVAVVVALRVRAGEQHGVIRETLAEVRHPSRRTVAEELLLDYLLYPFPSLRVRQVH